MNLIPDCICTSLTCLLYVLLFLNILEQRLQNLFAGSTGFGFSSWASGTFLWTFSFEGPLDDVIPWAMRLCLAIFLVLIAFPHIWQDIDASSPNFKPLNIVLMWPRGFCFLSSALIALLWKSPSVGPVGITPWAKPCVLLN